MLRSILLAVIVFALAAVSAVHAKDTVVVVPMASHRAVGDAEVTDVTAGKTFSNASETGLTGTRPPVPVAKNSNAVNVPSFFIPAFNFIVAGGRLPASRKVSSRVRNNLTGRPDCLAINAASIVYLPGCNLLPNPPPT